MQDPYYLYLQLLFFKYKCGEIADEPYKVVFLPFEFVFGMFYSFHGLPRPEFFYKFCAEITFFGAKTIGHYSPAVIQGFFEGDVYL